MTLDLSEFSSNPQGKVTWSMFCSILILQGLSIDDLQLIHSDPKDNGVAAMFVKPFHYYHQHGIFRAISLSVQG